MQYANSQQIRSLLSILRNPRCASVFQPYNLDYIRRGALTTGEYKHYRQLADKCSRIPFDADDAFIPNDIAQVVNPDKCTSVVNVAKLRASRLTTSLFDALACGLHTVGQHMDKSSKELAEYMRSEAMAYLVQNSTSKYDIGIRAP